MIRRLLIVGCFVSLLLGLTAMPASAAYKICPYVKLGGHHYVICIPIP